MNPTALPASVLRPLRVLVIDDNADAADSLEQLLGLDGHEVRTANTGRAGLAAAASFAPHLVLLDIGLPDQSGYDVARQMRAAGGEHRAYLVALTGRGQSEDRDDALAAGFDLHITKPIDLQQLDELVRSVRPPEG